MTTNPQEVVRRADRESRISLLSGLLALTAVCAGIVPIPLTGYICFPTSVILAALSGVYAVRALRRFPGLSANDKAMSIAGLIAGAATLMLTAVSVVLAVILGHRLIDAVRQFVP